MTAPAMPRGAAGSAWRRLWRPALATLPVLLILLGLGTWQVERLAWKTALLARIAAAEAAPPLPLDGGGVAEPYAKVLATGRFRHDREALLGFEPRGERFGAHLLTPLERGAGRPALLVDRGWVPLDRRGVALAADAAIARPAGEVAVTGYVRPAQRRSWVAATDEPARRHFYTFDPAAIGAALGLGPVEPRFGLVALAAAPGAEAGGAEMGGAAPGAAPGPALAAALPAPARSLPRPPNDHLGYAITWYGLALGLVGVFAAWARRRLKEPGPDDTTRRRAAP